MYIPLMVREEEEEHVEKKEESQPPPVVHRHSRSHSSRSKPKEVPVLDSSIGVEDRNGDMDNIIIDSTYGSDACMFVLGRLSNRRYKKSKTILGYTLLSDSDRYRLREHRRDHATRYYLDVVFLKFI